VCPAYALSLFILPIGLLFIFFFLSGCGGVDYLTQEVEALLAHNVVAALLDVLRLCTNFVAAGSGGAGSGAS
jgi:hypothetical protein